jgi:hypothetical protein
MSAALLTGPFRDRETHSASIAAKDALLTAAETEPSLPQEMIPAAETLRH